METQSSPVKSKHLWLVSEVMESANRLLLITKRTRPTFTQKLVVVLLFVHACVVSKVSLVTGYTV